MKRIFTIASIALVAVLALSCRKNTSEAPAKYQPAPKLTFNGPGALEFEAEGSEICLLVDTFEPVTVTSSAEWVKVEISGRYIYISAPLNNSIYPRYSTVELTAGDMKASLQAKQHGVPSDYFWEDEYAFPYAGSSVTLKFFKTLETVRVDIDGQDWISVDLGSEELTINIAKNPYKETRQGTVTWTAGKDVRVINIVQALNPGGSDDPGDDPGDDPEGADGSFAGYLGTWEASDGSTLEIESYSEGQIYTVYYSGFSLEGETVAFPALYEDNKIVFYSYTIYEYDDAPLSIMLVGFDSDGYIELGGPDEDEALAYTELSNEGKTISIVGNEYDATYSGTEYHEVIVELRISMYADEDYENYKAGYFYGLGMDPLELPASFTKTGSSKSTWKPMLKGASWKPDSSKKFSTRK